MAEVALNDEQQDVVRRYVAVWRRWRQGIRGFADLEDHMEQRHEVLVDGIAVDNRPGRPVIAGDAKDGKFHAAIFGNDDAAVPDLTAEELRQLRQYIIRRKGGLPVRSPEPKADLVTRPQRRASLLIAAVVRRARWSTT